jgi:hypothetical protein
METISLIIGGIITILITVFTENMRRPRLTLRIIEAVDNYYEGRPANRAKYLLLEIENKSLPLFARWMSRNAAMQCHGTITFHHLDGQNVFGRSMEIRWSSAPEPVPTQVVIDGHNFGFFDHQRFQTAQRIDLYPGERDNFSVVARLDSEADCWGWSNESYFCERTWRNEKWKLRSDRYLVRVSIRSAGEHVSDIFRLVNDVSIDDYRLEAATDEDKIKIRA